MKIYVDAESKCHKTNPDGAFREVDHPFFDGKCDGFIEGFCYVDSDGNVYIYPWKPYSEMDAAQRQYEQKLISDYESALAEIEAALGV